MRDAEVIRATNRVLLNDLYNGLPPFTESECEEGGHTVNVNWLEGTNLMWNARRQYENAFTKPANYFSVNVDIGKNPIKRRTWGKIITKHINRVMKRRSAYFQLVRSKFAGVVLHGTGAQLWPDKDRWFPDFVAVEDLLIPTDTECSLENLVYFAIRREYTVGELYRMTHGDQVDPGWNIEVVDKVLKDQKNYDTRTNYYTWSDSPEKLAELFKQNLAYFESDAAPSVTMWDFYHLEDDDERKGWYRKMLLDVNGPDTTTSEFVYDSGDRVFAGDLSRLLHVQFGDGNNKPPFLYHSVRSLGFLLYSVCQMMNRLRSKFTEHVFEQLMMLFRIVDPVDRDRLKKILLYNKGIIPEGMQVVPQNERHQINANIAEMAFSQYKQLMSESSSSYVPDADTGTSREQTATEVMAKVNSMNSLISSMLTMAYVQETFAYQEICRRFMRENSSDEECKKTRGRIIAEGVPEEALDVERWEIEPEQVMGGGNKILGIAQAKELMSILPQLPPESQEEVKHMFVEELTDNPKLAEKLVPTDQAPQMTDGMHDAENGFGTLMQGLPVSQKRGVNPIETVQVWLRMLGMKIQMINQSGGVGTQQDVMGLSNVARNIAQRIQLIAQDKKEKEQAKGFSDALGQLMNQVKAMAQRQAQAAQTNGQPDPETIAKIQSDQASDNQKRQSKEMANRQKLAHKQQAFAAEQKRKDREMQADIQREHARTGAELFKTGVMATADARRYKAFGGDEE